MRLYVIMKMHTYYAHIITDLVHVSPDETCLDTFMEVKIHGAILSVFLGTNDGQSFADCCSGADLRRDFG